MIKNCLITIMILMLLSFNTLRSKAPTNNVIDIFQGTAIYDPYLPLWDAICMFESTNNPNAINYLDPNGGSWGIAQIGKAKLKDYNKANGTNYTLNDCLNEQISQEIFLWHCHQWGSYELAAKRWNGSGPKTIIYWNKIKQLL